MDKTEGNHKGNMLHWIMIPMTEGGQLQVGQTIAHAQGKVFLGSYHLQLYWAMILMKEEDHLQAGQIIAQILD
jgi:hypothetical protein